MTELELKFLIYQSKKIISEQPVYLEIQAPIIVCGDTHGQYTDLLRLFEVGGYPPDANYLFLGDFFKYFGFLGNVCKLFLFLLNEGLFL